MARRQTRGRQPTIMRQIENVEDKLITFSKRRSGIYKKASELATLCGSEVGVVTFSPAGKPYSFADQSIGSIANRFLGQNPPQNDGADTLVESYRRLRIGKLNQQYDELVNQVEADKARGRPPSSIKIVDESIAQNKLFNRWNLEGRNRRKVVNELPARWKPPEKGKLKYNVDGSWSGDSLEGSIAGICRNSDGVVIDGCAEKTRADSALAIEALALHAVLSRLEETQKLKTPVDLSAEVQVVTDNSSIAEYL
ncbi:agamous-like MADS-box protein AGL61 [Rhodamnia argentea]|uniref:Agamous-like MADS-box protein AGL61 n=1 Tax=Rhodamnia argentea TaxID=178133 RepID=A0ABM3H6E7_9MYRT|nr:agamous-like MADS-box protein AGL61 [Rhodamnia argentea]